MSSKRVRVVGDGRLIWKRRGNLMSESNSSVRFLYAASIYLCRGTDIKGSSVTRVTESNGRFGAGEQKGSREPWKVLASYVCYIEACHNSSLKEICASAGWSVKCRTVSRRRRVATIRRRSRVFRHVAPVDRGLGGVGILIKS